MAEVWHWDPSALGETLQFSTDILSTRSAETRESRKDATQFLDFAHVVTPETAEAMIGLYQRDTDQVFAVPEWPTATISASVSIAATDTVIPVEDSVVYSVGQEVLIGQFGADWETGVVDAVGAGEITLSAGVVGNYTASETQRVYVAPLVRCIAPDGIKQSARYKLRDVSVGFLSVAPVDLAQNAYATYLGLPLVLDGYVLGGGLNGGVNQVSELFESAFGNFSLLSAETFVRRTGTLSFADTGYAQRLIRRRFLHYMRGRSGEMWVGSGQNDLVLNTGFLSGTTILNVQPVLPAAQMEGRHIIVSQGGVSRQREIISATDNTPTSQSLQIAAIGFIGSIDASVGFLTRCRFDTDDMGISYQFLPSEMLARSAYPFVEVP